MNKKLRSQKLRRLNERNNSKTSHTQNRSFFKHRQASQKNKLVKKRFASLAKPIVASNYNMSEISQDQNYINIRTDFVDYKSKRFAYIFSF